MLLESPSTVGDPAVHPAARHMLSLTTSLVEANSVPHLGVSALAGHYLVDMLPSGDQFSGTRLCRQCLRLGSDAEGTYFTGEEEARG